VPLTGEPLWLPDDAHAVVELIAYEDSLCPGCRHPRDESFHPDSQDHYDVTALRCHACAARGRADEQWDGDRAGLYLIPVEGS
jgi:hypothetical protein